MPQLTLEYTGNIVQKVHAHELLPRFHQALEEIAGIRIENCKSRAIRLDDYYIGDGTSENAFVHLEIRLFEGRPAELKQKIGQHYLDILKGYFEPSSAKLALQITVEIQDIQRQSYLKVG